MRDRSPLLLVGVLAAALILLLPLALSQFALVLWIEILLLGLFALSFNLLFGYTGLLSFGHAAFFATAAYVVAYLVVQTEVPFLLAALTGIAAATVLALAVGYLSVRLNEIYFAMVTLAFGMMVFTVVFQWREVTGGSDGLAGVLVEPFRLGGLTLDLRSHRTFYYVSLVIVTLASYVLWRITRAAFGETLRAIRENPERAAFVGIDVRRHQWFAFIIAGFFAGIAGALFAPFNRIASPDMAHWTFSARPVLMTILGGSRVFLGPMVGAVILTYLEQWVTSQTEHWTLILGLILLPLILFFPGGVMGYVNSWWQRRFGQAAVARPESTPTAVAAPAPPSPNPPPAQANSDTGGSAVLEVRDLYKAFGAVQAVNGVNLQVREGSITAIIGPNGAGKTTFYNLVSGRFRPDQGSVRFNGQEISHLPPHRIAHLGLGRSFQITSVFPHLTVRENVRVAVTSRRGGTYGLWRSIARVAAINAEVDRILDQVGIRHLAERPVSTLSHGDKALVEVAIVLAMQPRLVLLDEPTSGMSQEETGRMVRLIKRLRDETGCTFLITEHDMEVVFSVADRIVVMHQGSVLADGTPAEVEANAAVREAYLGTRG